MAVNANNIQPVSAALSKRGAGPNYIIDGNANGAQGQTWTTLQDLPTNTNINATSSIDSFNVYPKTTLDNSYLYYSLETSDKTTSNIVGSGDRSSVTFQFSLPSWTRTTDMYLDVPITLSCTTVKRSRANNDYNRVDPITINNPAQMMAMAFENRNDILNPFLSMQEEAKDSATSLLPGYPFSKGLYPNRPILQLFNSFQLFAGNNNQNIGRTTQFDAPFNQFISYYGKTGEDSAPAMGQMGPACSNVRLGDEAFDARAVGDEDAHYYVTCFSDSDVSILRENKHLVQEYEKLLRQCSEAYGADATENEAKSKTTFTKTLYISLRMSKLFEFLNVDAVLPPEFKFKITMVFKNDPITIYKGIQRIAINDTEGNFAKHNDVDFQAVVNKDMSAQIKYRGRVLAPPLQSRLNEMWMRNAFTYNYETCDPFIIKSNEWPYQNKTICTSSQRPLQLIIAALATANGSVTKQLPANDATGIVSTIFYQENQIIPWFNQNYEPVMIEELKVTISGKPIIMYSNYSTTQNDSITTGFENILNDINRQDWLGYDKLVGDYHPHVKGTLSSASQGYPFFIPLSPGQVVDTSKYPMDLGAVQINVTIKCPKLHSDAQIVILKKIPIQLVVDTNQKVYEVQWPARVVYMGGEVTLEQNQVKMNN